MYFPMSGGGGAKPEEIGIKYDETNDVVQLYYNGQWVDWKSGGMAYPVGTEINFGYTGDLQSFIVPATGIWKLEVWGAEGNKGNENPSTPGKGGYAYGNTELQQDDVLKIVVGGIDGYNGGGDPSSYAWTCGGGCTHIAKNDNNAERIPLYSYGNAANAENYVLIVGAGGGAGGYWVGSGSGGKGGGLDGYGGGSLSSASSYGGGGGSQSSGGTAGTGTTANGTAGTFGKGGQGGQNAGSGGGGWYGGGGGGVSSSGGWKPSGGGGGSSWYEGCISGTTGTTEGVQSGNGKAKLTYLGRGIV